VQKTGLLRSLGIFRNFCQFWRFFRKPRALLKFLQTSEDCGEIFDKYRGVWCKFARIY
jgi:hypothetical protein